MDRRRVVAVTASVGLPLSMVAAPEFAGLLQRCMFTVVYAWYARELVAGGTPQH